MTATEPTKCYDDAVAWLDANRADVLTANVVAMSRAVLERYREWFGGRGLTFRDMLGTLHGAYLDALRDAGFPDAVVATAADYLRTFAALVVSRADYPAPVTVEVRGRRWWQRSYGNTYHTAQVYVNGELVCEVPRTYGYGEQCLSNALDALEATGRVEPRRTYANVGVREAAWRWAERTGVTLTYSVEDVARQRDL